MMNNLKAKKQMSVPTSKCAERRARVRELEKALKKLFPQASIALHYTNPHELLFAVMLSAQCTDKKVNEVTETLFQKYPTVADYAAADLAALEGDVKQTGFFRSKAKNLKLCAALLLERHKGKVPQTMEELTALPGVARKTANIVLGTLYDVVEGIAVDTHVKRFALRYDLSDHTDTDKIERDLMEIVPKKDWYTFTYRVIEYGRHIAPARVYDTSKDPLVALYPPAGKRFRV